MDIVRKLNNFINKESSYEEFFQKKLKKYGVSSPDELEGDKKKQFFDEVDREWKAKKETD